MKLYASCPICGHKLCKGESGSEVDKMKNVLQPQTSGTDWSDTA